MKNRTVIHYIHVGKTAGTALQHSFDSYNKTKHRKYYFALHGHDFRLADIPDGELCVFSTRDPIQRFKSGFYSRKRKGAPRLNVQYSKEESIAFHEFYHANDLAEALSSSSKKTQLKAVRSMMAIRHVNSSYWDWFDDYSVLESNKDKVIGVLRQEHLIQDLKLFKEALNLCTLYLSSDLKTKHSNSYKDVPILSTLAVENLKKWYLTEYLFLNAVENIFGKSFFRKCLIGR